MTLNLPNTLVVLCEISGTVSCQSCFLTDVALCSPLHLRTFVRLYDRSLFTYTFIPPLFRLYYNTSLHQYLSTFLYVRKYHYFRTLLFYIRPAKMGSAQAKQYLLHNVTGACSLFQGLGKKSIVIHIAVSSTYPRLLP